MVELKNIYNKCVDIHNCNHYYFDHGYMGTKIEIFSLMNQNFLCPYNSRTDTVAKFCSNLKSCKSNYANGNVKHYTMKHKDYSANQNLYIPKTAINKTGIYVSHLGKIMKGIKEFFDMETIDVDNIGDSYLRHDKVNNKYYFIVSYYKDKREPIQNKKRVVSIDPGEKVPLSYFSQEGFGFMGIDMRKKILEIQGKIKRLQSVLSKYGNEIKNKKKIQKQILSYYNNIRNYVKEFHNKTALYLARNYDTIIIPVFETQNMISNTDIIMIP
jgi:putative transposase